MDTKVDTADRKETKSKRRRVRKSESVGIRDVAKRAGCSTATVSRAINKPDTVGEDVRVRVMAAIRELGYVPDSAARALSRRRSNTIGIIIPSIKDSIFAAQVEALQRVCSDRGFNMVIALSSYDVEREQKEVQTLIRNGVEGLMLVGGMHPPELYRLLASRNVAYVHTSVYEPDSPHPSIGFENSEASYRAANYLIELGHRRIGVMTPPPSRNDRARYRVAGISRALEAAGLELHEADIVECGYTIGEARPRFREWMAREPGCTALICHNDVMALAALVEAREMGITVPGQLSIVGFDDLEWASHIRPSLTTVRVAWGQMAALAGTFLIDTLAGETPAHSTRIDFDLVVRESAGRAPGR